MFNFFRRNSAQGSAKVSSIFDFTMRDIEGNEFHLGSLRGKKAYLLVNVATK